MSRLDSETSELINKIARHQGLIFIKKLLREKKKKNKDILLGGNKDAIITNLVTVIENDQITHSELLEWIREVEGWGNQHIYLFKTPTITNNHPLNKSEKQAIDFLKSLRLYKYLNSEPSMNFPEVFEIDSITFNDLTLQVTWHKKYDKWERDKSKDIEEEEIEGDIYRFNAYRQDYIRSIMRLTYRINKNQLVIFIQLPLGDEHRKAFDMAKKFINPIVGEKDLKIVKISEAIKKIDQKDLEAQSKSSTHIMQSENTKFEASGATIEFDADPTIGAWKSIAAVRQVRRALQTNDFSGRSAKFRVKLKQGTGMQREIKISLDGKDKRVYCFARVTNGEIWSIIDDIYSYAR